jgi:nucleoside-diphosphate-sugar epimerase
MRALVLGGGGFIGPHVAAALLRAGHEPIVVTRRGDHAAPGVECVAGDRADAAAFARLAAARGCDALIDMIAYEPTSTIALRDALAGRIGRYLLVSSADVYRNYGGLHRRETAPPDTNALGETAARRTGLYPYRADPPRAADDPDAWRDRYDKIPVEDEVAGPASTIVRLPMVYGPGDRNRRFAWIIGPMRKGAARLAAPEAWLNWRTSYGHVENVAAAIALCAVHPAAAGRVYNCGEPAEAHRAWVERCADLLAWRGEVTADEAAPSAAALAGLDLRYHLALDTTAIRTELGYKEALAPRSALQSVIDDEARR